MGMVNFSTVGPPKDLIHRLHVRFGLSVFVETGTYKGQTAAWASSIFDHVVTIEAAEECHRTAIRTYGHLSNVEFVRGDSREMLGRIVPRLTGPALFWLDAHWSGGSTYGCTDQCPVLEEIGLINASPHGHYLLIDDARYFTSPPPDPHPAEQWPDIRAVIHAVNSGSASRYIVIYEDVIIAVPLSARNVVAEYCRAHTSQALKTHEEPVPNRRTQPIQQSAGVSRGALATKPSTAASGVNMLVVLQEEGLWHDGLPLRLHLGCGGRPLPGYINVDYPSSEHNLVNVKADIHADITCLKFPARSVDEIRLHHVFEHFNRVTALALLIQWHQWLKVGGRILIETPDLMGCAQTLLAEAPWNIKMGTVRHLMGDQAAAWGYHLDQWFPERFERTLGALGYDIVQIRPTRWSKEPYLCNVTVLAKKTREVAVDQQVAAAEELLWASTVSPEERRTWEIWRKQLHAALSDHCDAWPSQGRFPVAESISKTPQILSRRWSSLPLEEIHNFNQRARNSWVQTKAASVPSGSRVLDVGAGTCPYRAFFSHCNYKTQDFKKYTGVKKTGGVAYGQIDYVSDITSIPVSAGSFDVVLCTEVLEHVPEPVRALQEMARILRPGGRLLLTAPLGSGLHQLPYHYYGGMSKQWYLHFLPMFGLEATEISPNGGFFKLLAQECARVTWTMERHRHLHGDNVDFIRHLFGEWLPRYLSALEDDCFIDQFTAGYHVEAVKTNDVGDCDSAVVLDDESPPVSISKDAS